MEEERDSKGVGEEKQDQEVAGEQDKAKKMEDELEKAKRKQEKKEGKKEMEGDNAKTTEEELVKKATRMQEKHEGKKEMEEDNAKKMEEELEKKVKRTKDKHEGNEVGEEEELEWDGEGQEVGLIKNQEADNNNIKKKSFVSKLVSPKVDDDPLTERLIKLEMRRELRWQARRVLGNGRNELWEFEQVVEVMNDLMITNIKDLEPQHYLLAHPSWKPISEPSVSLAEMQNEFRTHVTRILSEEGATDLKAYKHAASLLPSIKFLQVLKSLQEKDEPLQDSMPSLCGICQSPITEEDPFADEIALAALDEYAQDFHRPCLNSWLQEPQPTYLPRVEDDPMCRNIIIFKLIDKRDKGIAELNNIRLDTQMMTEFIGFLCHNPEFIPALLHFTVTTAASLNVEVQDDILTVVLYALSDLYYNKIKIGDLRAIRQLAKLLEESHKEAKKAAALAILSLCMAQENHQKALEANMVDMAVRLIGQKIVIEESLMTLWMLRNSRPAMTALASHEMVEQYLPIVLRNPSNPIQPESIEVTCHAFIQRDQQYYQIWHNIITVFRKSLGNNDSQREKSILAWLKFSTNRRNGKTRLCDVPGKEWWNFIM